MLAAGLLVRGGKSGVGGLLWGLLAWLLGLALAVGLGMLCVLLTKMLSGADLPWRAHPLPLRAAVWLAAFLGPGILARLLARRAGFWGLAFGAWLPFALLGLAAAVALPGATFQFLPATLLAGALLLAAAVAKHQPDEMRDTLLIIAGLAGGLFWLQVARNLEMAMGFQIPALILVPVALTASFFSPFFAVRPENRKMGSGLLLEAAAAMVVAVVIASLVVDTASEDNPQPVTFEYFAEAGANADTNTAHWLVAAAREMPASVRGAAEFERNRDLPPGLRPWPWIAPAEPVGLDAPTVDLLADVEIDGERRLTLRPHTARGGTQLRLLVPDAAKPLSVEIDDGTHPLKPERPIRGYHYITYNGPPRADWRLTLHLASTAPFELLLYEVSHGLPESGAALLEARPKSAQPRGFGDATRVLRRVEIPALGEALLTPTGDTAETAETASDTAEAG